MFVHCAAYRLNLVLLLALSISSVRNRLGGIKDITNLFRNTALADQTLKNHISKHVPESKRTRLVVLFKTRFIERHNANNQPSRYSKNTLSILKCFLIFSCSRKK